MENQMFCFQCQETAKGAGCILREICGKLPQTANEMDLLLSIVRAVGTIAHSLKETGVKDMPAGVDNFICDALFSTITNANFDDASLLLRVEKGIKLRNKLIAKAKENNVVLPNYEEITWKGDKNSYDEQAKKMSVLRNAEPDTRSLKELTMLGLKGMAAYYEHASRLGLKDEKIIDFMSKALAAISNPKGKADELLSIVLETGKYGVDVMALLDKANTTAFGNPEIITQRMRLSSLRKQRPTLISMSWANTSPLLAMKQTYVTMSLLGLYLAFGTKNIRLSVQHSRMVKLHSTV